MADKPKSTADADEGLTTFERIDLMAVEHQQKMEREREANATKIALSEKERRTERVKAVAWTITGIFFFALAAWISLLIFRTVNGTDQDAVVQQERETACIERGGGWVPKEMLVADSGLCVFPGKTAS